MNITPEQYYWFIHRRLIANLHKANYGGSNKILISLIDEKQPYLFRCDSDGSYDVLEESRSLEDKYLWIPLIGRCSSYKNGSKYGRNYDWYFDQAPEFVVRTPATKHHPFAALGIALVMSINAKDVAVSNSADLHRAPCLVVDGINSAGLACNINVCPVGDNPNYPDSKRAIYPEGMSFERRWNITYGTDSTKPRCCIIFIVRMILDNCGTVDSAIDLISLYSWFSTWKNEKFREEFHLMIGDLESTAIVEFVENEVIVHRWGKDNHYEGCNVPAYLIGADVKPIMTNFYLSKWDGDISNINMKCPLDEKNLTITDCGQGLERYLIIDLNYDKEDPFEVMKLVRYRLIYGDNIADWASEFLALPDATFRNNIEDIFVNTGYFDLVHSFVEKEDIAAKQGIRPLVTAEKKTWHTVHTSIFDLEKKTMKVCVQEDDQSIYKFKYNELYKCFIDVI